MDKYTASNGIGVRIDSPYLDIKDGVSWRGIAGSRELIALREFFAQERDEELGRWRWPENPDYVVYPNGEYARVLREHEGTSEVFHRLDSEPGSWKPAAAARAYFDAHPEPKPWDDAKPGEVWLLTLPEIGETAYVAGDHTFTSFDHSLTFGTFQIISGRRIFPEPD